MSPFGSTVLVVVHGIKKQQTTRIVRPSHGQASRPSPAQSRDPYSWVGLSEAVGDWDTGDGTRGEDWAVIIGTEARDRASGLEKGRGKGPRTKEERGCKRVDITWREA